MIGLNELIENMPGVQLYKLRAALHVSGSGSDSEGRNAGTAFASFVSARSSEEPSEGGAVVGGELYPMRDGPHTLVSTSALHVVSGGLISAAFSSDFRLHLCLRVGGTPGTAVDSLRSRGRSVWQPGRSYSRRLRWHVDSGKRISALGFSDDGTVLSAATEDGLLYLLPADRLLLRSCEAGLFDGSFTPAGMPSLAAMARSKADARQAGQARSTSAGAAPRVERAAVPARRSASAAPPHSALEAHDVTASETAIGDTGLVAIPVAWAHSPGAAALSEADAAAAGSKKGRAPKGALTVSPATRALLSSDVPTSLLWWRPAQSVIEEEVVWERHAAKAAQRRLKRAAAAAMSSTRASGAQPSARGRHATRDDGAASGATSRGGSRASSAARSVASGGTSVATSRSGEDGEDSASSGLESCAGRYLFVGFSNGRLAMVDVGPAAGSDGDSGSSVPGVVWSAVLDPGGALTSLALFGDAASLRLAGLWRFSQAAAHGAHEGGDRPDDGYAPPSEVRVPETSLVVRSANAYWRLKLETALPVPLLPTPASTAPTPSKAGGSKKAEEAPAPPYRGLQPLGSGSSPSGARVPLYTATLLDACHTALAGALWAADAASGQMVLQPASDVAAGASAGVVDATKTVPAAVAAAERAPGGPLAQLFEAASSSSSSATSVLFCPTTSATGAAAAACGELAGLDTERKKAAAAASGGGWLFGGSGGKTQSLPGRNATAAPLSLCLPSRCLPPSWVASRLRQSTRRSDLSVQLANKGPLIAVTYASDARLRLFDPSLGEDPLFETQLPLPWAVSAATLLRDSYDRILRSEMSIADGSGRAGAPARRGRGAGRALTYDIDGSPRKPARGGSIEDDGDDGLGDHEDAASEGGSESDSPAFAARGAPSGSGDSRSTLRAHSAAHLGGSSQGSDRSAARPHGVPPRAPAGAQQPQQRLTRGMSSANLSLPYSLGSGSSASILPLPESVVLYSDRLLFVAQNPVAQDEHHATDDSRVRARTGSTASLGSVRSALSSIAGSAKEGGDSDDMQARARIMVVSVNQACRSLRDSAALEAALNRLSTALPLAPGAAVSGEWPPADSFSLPSQAVVQTLVLPPGCYVRSMDRVPLLQPSHAAGLWPGSKAAVTALAASAPRDPAVEPLDEGEGEDASGELDEEGEGGDIEEDEDDSSTVHGGRAASIHGGDGGAASVGSVGPHRVARPPIVSLAGPGGSGGSGGLLFTVAVHTTGGTFAVAPCDVLDVDAAIARLIASPAVGILQQSQTQQAQPQQQHGLSDTSSALVVQPPQPSSVATARRQLGAIERLCFSLSLDPAQAFERMADAACARVIDAQRSHAGVAAAVASLGGVSGGSGGSSSTGRSLCDYYRTLNADALPAALVATRPAPRGGLGPSEPLASAYALYGLAAGLGGGLSHIKPVLVLAHAGRPDLAVAFASHALRFAYTAPGVVAGALPPLAPLASLQAVPCGGGAANAGPALAPAERVRLSHLLVQCQLLACGGEDVTGTLAAALGSLPPPPSACGYAMSHGDFARFLAANGDYSPERVVPWLVNCGAVYHALVVGHARGAASGGAGSPRSPPGSPSAPTALSSSTSGTPGASSANLMGSVLSSVANAGGAVAVQDPACLAFLARNGYVPALLGRPGHATLQPLLAPEWVAFLLTRARPGGERVLATFGPAALLPCLPSLPLASLVDLLQALVPGLPPGEGGEAALELGPVGAGVLARALEGSTALAMLRTFPPAAGAHGLLARAQAAACGEVRRTHRLALDSMSLDSASARIFTLGSASGGPDGTGGGALVDDAEVDALLRGGAARPARRRRVGDAVTAPHPSPTTVGGASRLPAGSPQILSPGAAFDAHRRSHPSDRFGRSGVLSRSGPLAQAGRSPESRSGGEDDSDDGRLSTGYSDEEDADGGAHRPSVEVRGHGDGPVATAGLPGLDSDVDGRRPHSLRAVQHAGHAHGHLSAVARAQELTELWLAGLCALQTALAREIEVGGLPEGAAPHDGDGVDARSEPLARLLRSQLELHKLWYRPATVVPRCLDYRAWDATASVCALEGEPRQALAVRLHGLACDALSMHGHSSDAGAQIGRRAIALASTHISSFGARPEDSPLAASTAQLAALRQLLAFWATHWHALHPALLLHFVGGEDSDEGGDGVRLSDVLSADQAAVDLAVAVALYRTSEGAESWTIREPGSTGAAGVAPDPQDDTSAAGLLATLSTEGVAQISAAGEATALRSLAVRLQACDPALSLRLTLAYAQHCASLVGRLEARVGAPARAALAGLLGDAVTGTVPPVDGRHAGKALTAASAAVDGMWASEASITDSEGAGAYAALHSSAPVSLTSVRGSALPASEARRWYDDASGVTGKQPYRPPPLVSAGSEAVAASTASAAESTKDGKASTAGSKKGGSKAADLYARYGKGDGSAEDASNAAGIVFGCGHTVQSSALSRHWLPLIKARLGAGVDVDVIGSADVLVAEAAAAHAHEGAQPASASAAARDEVATAATRGGRQAAGTAAPAPGPQVGVMRADPIAALLLIRAYQQEAGRVSAAEGQRSAVSCPACALAVAGALAGLGSA